MISDYIYSIFTNCKSLVPASDFHAAQVQAWFSAEIERFRKVHAVNTEEDLVSLLVSENHAKLQPLLDTSAIVKIFYLVNSLSEYNAAPENYDALGRYAFAGSVQEKCGITRNLVLELIHASIHEQAVLAANFRIVHQPSFFFLSHDIDSLFGSLVQDGLWALKKKRFDVMLKLFANVLVAKPHWFNIDRIMQLESEYDFKSTFYWLVNKGRVDQRQTNADYDIGSGKVSSILQHVRNNGFENGLHKSISTESFAAELGKLPVKVPGNRYHYLKFKLPQAYDLIEQAGLQLDASLGFAEHYGFRNSYGYPFSPYNLRTKQPYSFLEVPLTLMDGTFQRYLQVPVNKTAETAIAFLEKNRQNCLLSVLWHNTFFTAYKYKGYKQEYVKLLQYLHEQTFRNINQSQIIEQFAWKK